MAVLTNISLLLALACVSHQLVLSSCQKTHGKKGSRGQNKDKPVQNMGPQPKPAPARLKGKLVTTDKSECTWSVTGNDLLTLRVTCQKGVSRFSCEYNARPSICPQYSSKAELYWKQMARALKKHQSLCQESNVPIKAGLCRRAAKEAHFRLSHVQEKTSTPPPPTQPEPRAVKSCQDDNMKRAEEYCSNSWSSVCLFFFTMVQDYDC